LRRGAVETCAPRVVIRQRQQTGIATTRSTLRSQSAHNRSFDIPAPIVDNRVRHLVCDVKQAAGAACSPAPSLMDSPDETP